MSDVPIPCDLNPADRRRPSISIVGMMVFAVVAALLAMSARHANRAVREADELNYAGDSDSQDLCVLAETIPSMFFAAIAGLCSGLSLNRTYPMVWRFKGRSTLMVLLISGLLFCFAPGMVQGTNFDIHLRLIGCGVWSFGIACVHYNCILQPIKNFCAEEATRGW
ncbi:MAG: hypothetical protein ABI353_21655 [Isosphaeraceae bacterium]